MSSQVKEHPDLHSTLQRYHLSESDLLQPLSNDHLQKIASSHCQKWRSLPVPLKMANHLIWEDIERDLQGEERRRNRLFSCWQSEKGDDANYKTLINALLEIKCKLDAQYVCELLSGESRDHDNNQSQLVRENFTRIRGCYASLVKRIARKLSSMNINMVDFRTFIVYLFPPGDFISDTRTIFEIFQALIQKRLWDYSSCSALQSIYKEFGERDTEMKTWIDSYRAELAGFKATTKIIDYIKNCSSALDEIADSEESISQNYDKKYCQRLKMKLKCQITERSLEYIDEFWESVAEIFNLPSLPICLDSIHEGCTEISWLISTQSAFQVEAALRSITFLQQHQVGKLSLDDKVLYEIPLERVELEEEKMVKNQLTVKEIEIIRLREEMKALKAEIIRLRKENQEPKNIKEAEGMGANAEVREIDRLRKELEKSRALQEKTIAKNMKLQENLMLSHQLQNAMDDQLKLYRLREDLGQSCALRTAEPPSLQVHPTWKHCFDMPQNMDTYVQAVVVQGKVYVAGGWEQTEVIEYDINSEEWSTLLPYKKSEFAMAVISNQLVLVGGYDYQYLTSRASDVVGVWGSDSKEWIHPYPAMPTPRSHCSAVSYGLWLVVAGGYDDDPLSCVEVLDTDNKQWYIGPPTPRPWDSMKTAVVGDIGYFMGDETVCVYSASLPALISHLSTADSNQDKDRMEIWKEISGLQLAYSAPLSMNGSLFALGGEADIAATAIHYYQPNTGNWVKVGDFPTARYDCTCAMIGDNAILVAGGRDNWKNLSTVDIAIVNTQ